MNLVNEHTKDFAGSTLCYNFAVNKHLGKLISALSLAVLITGCSSESASTTAPPATVSTSFKVAFADTSGTSTDSTSMESSGWRNETVFLRAYSTSIITAVTPSDLVSSSNHIISSDQIEIGRIDSISATNSDTSSLVQVQDVVTDQKSSNEDTGWMIQIRIPIDAPADTYTGTISFTSRSSEQSLVITLKVSDRTLSSNTLSMELWQYPYSSLRYYSFDSLFTQSHIDYLKQELSLYHSAGGSVITTSIVDEPWGHQIYDDYPSMVQWTRYRDYSWYFDFTQFDTWVETCMSMGIDQKILAFSILPAYNRILFNDEVTGQEQTMYLDPGTDDWNTIWGLFTDYFIAHLEEKGWLDITYLAIDEKDTASTSAAISLLKNHVSTSGTSLKLAVYMNTMPEDTSVLDDIDAVSFAENVIQENPETLSAIADQRMSEGKTTTMYTCTDQYPNSFAYSSPEESIWTILFARSTHMSGFVRWALDAFNEDPLVSTDIDTYESGDTMLIYPGSDNTCWPSVRLLMLQQGMQDVAKYNALINEIEDNELQSKAQSILDEIASSHLSVKNHDTDLVISQVQNFEALLQEMEESLDH